MKKITEHGATTQLPVYTRPTREVHIDIDARDLVSTATDMDWVIVRVVGLVSGSGRPVTKSIRIHSGQLQRTDRVEDWN